METATMILIFSAFGLVMILGWTVYRIRSHRRKISNIEDLSISIGEKAAEPNRNGRKGSISSPVIPENDLLVVMFTGKEKPWRDAAWKEMRTGRNVMVVSDRSPERTRKIYPGIHRMIWLDRSTAHKPQSGVTVTNPTNLSGVLDELRTNGSMKDRADLVVFEEFEGMISANDPERTIRFLSMVKELCQKDSFSVVVPIAYKAVKQRTRNRFQETFETVVI